MARLPEYTRIEAAEDVAPARLSQVQDQLECQEREVTNLLQLMDALEERLDRVLLPEPAFGKENTPIPVLVSLASEIRNNTERIERCASRVHSIVQRLEI